jgi:HEPN domain-containing protein
MPRPDRRVIAEWFEYAQRDFDCAEFLVNQSVFPHQAMVHLQQASEKILKAFLLSRGWELVKTHDLRALLDEAIKHDKRFEKFADTMKRLTERYVEERYPGEPLREVTLDEARECHVEVSEFIALIRSLTP